MIGLGFFTVGLAAAGLWLLRKGRDPGKWFTRLAVLGIFAPLLANAAGWTFTETGRQPWVVSRALLTTAQGVVADRRRRDGADLARRADAALRRARGRRGVAVHARAARAGPSRAPKPVTRTPTATTTCLRLLSVLTMDLQTLWFVVVAVLWTGFLILEGFDFGVAALLPVVGRTESERHLMLRTIGPVWDGNEVWLITAAGAVFAAFPGWYATWLRPLPAVRARAARPDRAGGGLRVAARTTTRGGGAPGRRDRRVVAAPALLWGVAFANTRRLPIAEDGSVRRAASSTCCGPTRCSAARRRCSCSACTARQFLALQTDGAVRCARRGRALRWRRTVLPLRRGRGLDAADAEVGATARCGGDGVARSRSSRSSRCTARPGGPGVRG